MTKSVDFQKYSEFVNAVTSDASTDFLALSDRLVELDEKGANIERLLTAGVGINAEGGEFLEIMFSSGHLRLRKVCIHFITIKVSIVGFAVAVVQPHDLLPLEDPRLVSHNAGLVQGRLSVEQHGVTVLQMSVHNLGLANIDVPLIAWSQQCLGNSLSL